MFSKKIILITGSSGFIGTEVVNKLKKNKKIILYLLINKNKKKKIKKSKNIIHCAWSGVSGRVRNSHKQNINLKITNNLLNVIRCKKIKCFIALGSQAEYGSKFYKIYENSKLRPRTKYGKIKIKILKKIRIYCIKNNIRFVWLRIFTGYGPNSENNWIIPSTIFKLINNQETKFTSGNQIYNFIYVSDIASAIKKSLFNKNTNGIFNLGSQKSYTIKYVIKLIFKKLKIKKRPLFGELDYRNDQIMKFSPSILKIKKNLKWQPQYSISHGLNKTIKFIKENNNI